MSVYKELKFTQEIIDFVLNKAKKSLNSDDYIKFVGILEKTNCGLFINERMMNLPLQLIPPLLNCLVTDINSYKEDNPNCNKFDLDYVLIISKYITC